VKPKKFWYWGVVVVITAGLLVNQQVKVLSKKRSHPEKPYNAHREISHDAHLGVPQSAGRTPRRKNPQVRGFTGKSNRIMGHLKMRIVGYLRMRVSEGVR
jgi:hypothetical protein